MKKILLIIIIVSGLLPRINQKGQLVIGNNTAMVYGQQNEGDPFIPDPDCGKYGEGGCEEKPPQNLPGDPTDPGTNPTDPDPQAGDWPDAPDLDPGDADNMYGYDPNNPINDEDWGYPSDWNLDGFPSDEDYEQADEEVPGGSRLDTTNYYYITVSGNNSVKFYDNSTTIFSVDAKKKVRFDIHLDNGAVVPESGLEWEKGRYGILVRDKNYCGMILNTPDTFQLSVYSTDPPAKKLITIKVVVYDRAIVNFHLKNNYLGEYGFDEEGYQYQALQNDYESRNIGNTPYNVAWMSLLDGQSDSIKVTPIVPSAAKVDVNFWVRFKSTNPFIKINGMDSLPNMNASALSLTKSIKITAYQWDTSASNRSQSAIIVINNNGDTVGKLNLSCQKPTRKKLAFVYVKTDTAAYKNAANSPMSKDSLIKFLNKRSHNQIFKEWVVESSYQDTIDLTNEYSSNPNSFINMPNAMNNFYRLHTGVNVANVNYNSILNYSYQNTADTNKIHFIYVTNFLFKTNIPKDTLTAGISTMGGFTTTIFKIGDPETLTHELGHSLNLWHTFIDSTDVLPPGMFSPGIPKFNTLNFMDYSQYKNSPPKIYFFYYQWGVSL